MHVMLDSDFKEERLGESLSLIFVPGTSRTVDLTEKICTNTFERVNCPSISSSLPRRSVSMLLPSSNVTDLITDTAQAIADAKSGDWVSAALDSVEVAKDIIDVATEVGDAFVDSRIEAVTNDYAENSDVGFQ